jgi:flagellar motor switch protein FliM
MPNTKKNSDFKDIAHDENLIDEIIKMSNYNFDRLPMLEIIAERLATSLSSAIPQLSKSTCDVSLTKLDYLPMHQAISDFPSQAFYCVGESASLDGQLLLALEVSTVLTTMDLCFGDISDDGTDDSDREITAIEKSFSQRLLGLVLAELQNGLEFVGGTDLNIVKLTTDSDDVVVTQLANLCIRMVFEVIQVGKTGTIQIVIPYEMLDPLRSKLGRIHFGEQNDESNSTWQVSITGQIERAEIEVEVELTTIALSIQHAMNWQVGDKLDLGIKDDHEATVRLDGRRAFTAELGQRTAGNVALKITNIIQEGPEKNEHFDHH